MKGIFLDAEGERAYQVQRAVTTTPLDRLLMVYDLALTACHTHDLPATHRALRLLSRTLDFDADPELAGHLFRVYEYCQTRLRTGAFEEVASVLSELRLVWREAERQS